MRTQPIVLGLIEQGNEYILQRRNGHEQTGALGLVGCFGGKVESGETAEAAVAREISEETSLITEVTDWQILCNVAVVVEVNNEQISFPAKVFRTIIPIGQEISAKEGELVRIRRDLQGLDVTILTPATAAAFNELL